MMYSLTNRAVARFFAASTIIMMLMSIMPITAFANEQDVPVTPTQEVVPADESQDGDEDEGADDTKKKEDTDKKEKEEKDKKDETPTEPLENEEEGGEVMGAQFFQIPFPPTPNFDESDFPNFNPNFCLTIEYFKEYLEGKGVQYTGILDFLYNLLCGNVDDPTGDDVKICHATSSEQNAYNNQTVSVDSIFKNNGHDGHDDDIIPPFEYEFNDSVQQYPGKNWDTEGQAVWNNDCLVPDDSEPKQCVLFSDEETLADGNPAVLTYVHGNWTDEFDGGDAEWIWDAAFVTDPTNPQTVTFVKTFDVDVAPTSAALKVAADNQYAVTLNGNSLSCDGAAGDNHSVADTCAVDSGDFNVGSTNTLTFEVTNLAGENNPKSNPAGLIYELTIEGSECSIPDPEPEEDVATVVVTKLVCTDEADLPNWGTGGADITPSTAADWIVDHPSCSLASGWEFEWAGADIADPRDGDEAGTAGTGWTPFGPTDANGVATLTLDEDEIDGDAHVWIREILKPDYLEFSWFNNQDNSNDVSAEIYCASDVVNYDNWERVDGITLDETYHCVAWNVPVDDETETSETIVVRDADLETETDRFVAAVNNSGKWFFYNDENDTINNTLGSFVFGPDTAPLGDGSAEMTVSGTERRNLATYRFKDVPLEDITTLTYSTYSQSAGNGSPASERSAYLQFNVDFLNNDTWQRRLVHLPAANGVVVNDTWQEWDALDGGTALWLYSGNFWPAGSTSNGSIPGTTARTWNDILADYPNAETRSTDSWFGFRIGEPYNDGFTGNVDEFVIGIKTGSNTHTTTFDFEPDEVREPSVTLVATKVVCESEDDLPNRAGGADVTATTAAEWVAQSDGNCHIEPDWDFEWGPAGAGDGGPTLTGPFGGSYTVFSGTTTIPLSALNGRIEVREVLEEGYVPFSDVAEDNESAEFFCASDVADYDNWEWIQNPTEGATYHCVGFNALEPVVVADADVQMCKVDESGAPLSGWTLALLGDHMGTVDVHPDGATYTIAGVPAGDYVLEASGLYTYRADAVASTTDAAYSYRLASDAVYGGSYVPWVRVNDFPNPHTGWLGIIFNDAFTDWGSVFNPDHMYVHGTSTTATQDFDFKILDDQYGDNSGSLAVNLFTGYTGVTDEDGCVTFEDVPFGTYTATEIMQDGWEAGDGTDAGEVIVDETAEEFTLVNRLIEDEEEPRFCTVEIESDTTNEVQGTGGSAVLVTFINDAWDAVIGGVDWIWSTDPVETPEDEVTEVFTNTFEWDGVIDDDTETMLEIAADNSYRVWLNGTDVSDLIGEDASENNFGATDVYTDFEDLLIAGTNTLTIEVTNHALSGGTTTSNPAGLLYKLSVTGDNEDCEDDQDGSGNNGGNDDQHTLTILTSGDGTGLIEGAGISCHSNAEEGNNCSETYPDGTVVELTVTPDSDSNFDNSWENGSGTCTGNTTPCTVTLHGDITLTAHFDLNFGQGGGFVTSSGGSIGSRNTIDDADGEILGAQTSIMPIGAPNTGVGGGATTVPAAVVMSFIWELGVRVRTR